MITKNEAIQYARNHIAGWDWVDSQAVKGAVLSTRTEALAAGVKNSAGLQDEWLISFARIASGHPLDNVFPLVTIIVGAKKGETSVLEGI